MAPPKILKITSIDVKDIRIPTTQSGHGSDAMHPDPDYSCAYVVLNTDINIKGYSLSFTIGRGTEIVVCAIKALAPILINCDTQDIFKNFSSYWRKLTSDGQLRWLGPEKGVIHLASAAILNALWDLWARIENKPIWKLLTDMDPETLVSTIDFRYITDAITKEEAIKMLKNQANGKSERERQMIKNGYPAYTTQVGWIKYSDSEIEKLCHKYLKLGFTGFKIKVGINLDDDKRRCKIIRDTIGPDKYLLTDANQIWNIQEAIDWMSNLAEYKPLWIEEPTSPDDIMGHLSISKALNPYGIGVATGEVVCNRVMFKQYIQLGAMQHCQLDACRLGSINEILAVYLMACKYGIPVCPHGGGIGLCQMVQHLQMFDFICLSGKIKPGQFVEYVGEEHEHFVVDLVVKNGNYMPPTEPGYGVQMKNEAILMYEYPNGSKWKTIHQ